MLVPNKKSESKDFWEILKIIGIFVGAIGVPVVIALVGNSVSLSLKDQDVRLKMVELAIDILKEEPKQTYKEQIAIRRWAIDVVNAYSDVKLPADAISELERNSILGARTACWRRPDGRLQYLYNFNLQDDGIQVKFLATDRKSAAKDLGAPALSSKVKMSVKEFRASMRPVFEYSQRHDCRFFVEVFDSTSKKSSYIRNLRAVETFFYTHINDS